MGLVVCLSVWQPSLGAGSELLPRNDWGRSVLQGLPTSSTLMSSRGVSPRWRGTRPAAAGRTPRPGAAPGCGLRTCAVGAEQGQHRTGLSGQAQPCPGGGQCAASPSEPRSPLRRMPPAAPVPGTTERRPGVRELPAPRGVPGGSWPRTLAARRAAWTGLEAVARLAGTFSAAHFRDCSFSPNSEARLCPCPLCPGRPSPLTASYLLPEQRGGRGGSSRGQGRSGRSGPGLPCRTGLPEAEAVAPHLIPASSDVTGAGAPRPEP